MPPPLGFDNLDPRIGFASVRLSDAPFPITPGEEGLLSGKEVPLRQAEIRAGRHAAQLAMKSLGHPPQPVLRAPSRAPVWPKGLVGSIAHDATHAVAVAADETTFRSLGIDIEPAEALEADLWDALFHPEEIDALTETELSQGLAARAFFSAKESLFKALFPLCGLMFDFRDIRLNWEGNSPRFGAQSLRPDLTIPARLSGESLISGSKILTLVKVAR